MKLARSSNRLIDPFNRDIDFKIRRVRFDKIEVGISFGRCMTNNAARVHELFLRMRQSKWLLCDGSAAIPKLEIRKRKNSLLFTGSVSFRQTNSGGYLRAYITFNPTRYFSHNPSNRPRERSRSGSGYGPYYALTEYSAAKSALMAKSLDKSDNHVLDGRLREANETNWPAYTTTVLQEIIALISATIKHYDRNDLFTFDPGQTTEWVLRNAELYWEFRQPDAAVMAKIFGAYMANNYVRHRVTYHGDALVPAEDISGATCSWVFYSGLENLHFAMYAKTKDRIRIECRFTTNITKIFPKTFPDSPPYSRSLLSGLERVLGDLRNEASAYLYTIKSERKAFDPVPVMSAYDAVDTMTALNFAAGTDQISMLQVIKTIKMASRVSETGKPAFDACVHRMVARGLLKQIGRKKPDQPRHYQPSRAFSSFIVLLTIPNPAAGLWKPKTT